ncbi:bifunctional DNA-formamidopyrimidine glycosylase/DNA-(apurinic or apyrimidinic site) lyase [Erysipelothrix aquatica]|uniref:bifunctional DNA-formamidopyrimidine glycosylase/DNA-(apurinic or apyrimidinic site) lyase n=1 Tax=Erysipelothrix aquatica TaxID=2683714 RepID=UPI0013587FE3|nr:bifunctional DNA-formamidopyrimidine glycosylase/DNA-(apurinic or apyrimidinic site) lyase [Erysipelothrix aquatica]
MPELPEVETIVKTMGVSLLNEQIKAINLRYQPLLETGSEYPIDVLVGESFVDFKRRGKYVWFELTNGYNWIIHLRMEGKFHLYDSQQRPNTHTHLTFNTANHYVHYLDTRKFSRMVVTKHPEQFFESKRLGYEPWDEKLTSEYLKKKYSTIGRPIKLVLLDQAIFVGVGNIYADEILHDIRVHPLTPAKMISTIKLSQLILSARRILENAIQAGGTTIRSYTSGLNVHGRFQIQLAAYGQGGKPCPRCGTTMDRIVIGGRSSVFCPKCQKVKR